MKEEYSCLYVDPQLGWQDHFLPQIGTDPRDQARIQFVDQAGIFGTRPRVNKPQDLRLDHQHRRIEAQSLRKARQRSDLLDHHSPPLGLKLPEHPNQDAGQ